MGDEGKRFFAWAFALLSPWAERGGLASRRRDLLASAAGRVVEIGAGTGANLEHYPAAVEQLLATEPNRHMFKRLTRAVGRSRVPVRLQRAPASDLPVPDGAADVVVSTLVLCSVEEPSAALREAFRVLKPGGRLLFMEHVRSPDPRLAAKQDRWTRFHRRVAGGCHPNRDMLAAVQAAGFEPLEVERYDQRGLSIVRPHVVGSAVKPTVD